MKKTVLIALTAILTLSSCNSNKQESTSKEAPVGVEQSKLKGVQQMGAMTHNDTITIKGALYQYRIDRRPDIKLPIVTDDQGMKYADNRVVIMLSDSKGTTLFEHTFTKADFLSQLPEDFQKYGVLEGMAFNIDRISEANFHFSASICYPQTDLYLPFDVSINPTGEMTISRDNSFDDAVPNEKTSEEDGV